MNRGWRTGIVVRCCWTVGIVLTLGGAPARAQVGAISTQSLFFDQASNAHIGNYLAVEAGLVYTDNVNLTGGSGGDTLAMLGLVGDTAGDRPRFDYRLASDLSVVKYLHSSFETQPFGYLDGAGELKIIPGFLSWTARDTYNQAVINPFEPITPDNLEGINYVSTGPRLTVRPTLRTTITVDGTYSYVTTSSKSPFYVNIDNHRYGGDATISRAFSNTTSVYITGMTEKVEFTDQVENSDFKQDQALAGVKFANARTLVDISGGYTKLHLAAFTPVFVGRVLREVPESETPTGAIWRAEISRLISPTQRVSLYAVKQVSDAANLFQLNFDQPVPSTVPNRIATGQPFTDREFGATWRLQAQRTSLQFQLLDATQRYRATPTSDRDVKVASALLARQLNPVLNWDIGTSYEHDYYAVGGKLNTINAVTSLRWSLGEHLWVRFIYAHSTLTPNGYSDNQIGVTGSYAFTAVHTPGSEETPGSVLQPTSPMSSQPHPL